MPIFWKRLYFPVFLDNMRLRGGAIWSLVWLITRRLQVQILPPQPKSKILPFRQFFGFDVVGFKLGKGSGKREFSRGGNTKTAGF